MTGIDVFLDNFSGQNWLITQPLRCRRKSAQNNS